jgi:hypothetical protein
MLKHGLLALIVAIVIPLVLWAGADILEFSAESQGDGVLLMWRTGVELNLSTFQVQRSVNGTSFYSIADVEPTGSYSEYQYVDGNLLKDSIKTYYYRLKIVETNGAVTYSAIREVTLIFSGIQQTWGSIKAMFR